MNRESIGIFLLGLFLGYVCWHLVLRSPRGRLTIDSLVGVLGVFAGGALLKLLKDFLRAFADVWWYPIGVACGVALYVIVWLVNENTPGGETPPNENGQVFPTVLGVFKRSRNARHQ